MINQIINLPFKIWDKIFYYWFPKCLVLTLQRVHMFFNGISLKTLKISPNITLSYFERKGTIKGSPKVLMLPGFGNSKESFLQICTSLPKKYHVFAVDLPGHGQTICSKNEEFSIQYFVQQVKKFVDGIGISKTNFHILGNSLGGEIAGMYAITYPADIKSVSLFCPRGIRNITEGKNIEVFRKKGDKYIVFTESFEEFNAFLNDTVCHKKITTPAVIIRGLLILRNENRELLIKIAEKVLLEGDANVLEQNIDKLRAPLMLVWGKEDKVLDVSCVNVIKSKLPIPPEKVVVLEDCGHGIFEDQPKISKKMLIEYLDTF